MRSRFRWPCCVAIVYVLGMPSAAVADQTTGSIALVVSQEADRKATVEVFTAPPGSRSWSAEARGAQPIAIRGLPPGTYRIAVTFWDGTTANISVPVAQAEVVSLVAEPALGPTAAPVIRVVDRDRLSQGTYLDEREVRALPSGSGVSAWLDTLVPFVIADAVDAGGTQLGTTVRVGARGASAVDETVSLGEFVAERAPGGGNRPTYLPDPATIGTWSVGSGLASPETAGPGPTITIVPKRPGAARHGSVDASFTDPSMVSTNNPAGIPSVARLNSWKSAAVSFGAPLNRRTGLFVAGSLADVQAHARDLSTPSSATVGSAFAHVIHDPTSRMQARLIAGFQAIRRPYGEVRQFRESGIDERDRLFQSQATWEVQQTGGGRLTIGGGYERGAFMPSAVLPFGSGIDRALDGPVPPTASRTTADRTEARFVLDMPARRGHVLEFGLTAARSSSSSHQIDASPRAELVDGIPARVWVPREAPSDSHRTANHLAAYVVDHFKVAGHLTLDLGARLGRSSGTAAGGDRIAWNAVLPRAAFRWSPAIGTIYGGYGRYQSELPLDLLAFGDPGETVFDVYRWNDSNQNGRFDSGEGGVLVARSGHGRDVASIDPTLHAPYTDEFAVGLERRFGARLIVRAAQFARIERSIVRSVNVGAPLSSYAVRQIPDRGEDHDSASDDRPLAVYDRLPSSFGQDRYLLTTSPDETAIYDGTEISWEWRTRRWWSFGMASSYDTSAFGGNRGPRASENDQGLPGELLENPDAYSYSRGHVFYDRSYVLKLGMGYQAPHDFTISAVARYQDGQPFSRLVVVPDLAQGAELVNAYRAGRTRFTFTSTLDARFEKGFALGRYRATVRLEIFNLPNLGYEVEENPVTGPAFRRTTAVQPPRALRVGFRVEF